MTCTQAESSSVKFGGVGEFWQHGIVSRRLKQLHHATENWIQQGLSVSNVEIERCQIAAEMQLRIIIERAAAIEGQAVINRPAQNVAQGVKIEMQIERDGIVQAEIFVVDRAVVHHANAESNNASIESPDKKVDTFRHELTELCQIFLGQLFEFHRRPLMHRQVKRVDLVQIWRDIANDFEIDFGSAFGFAKFSSQTFACAIAQMCEIVVKVAKIQRQPGHRHTWYTGKPIT